MSAAALDRGSFAIPWWLILLQGIASLVLGLLLLAAPGASLIVLVQILGAYCLVSGIFGLVAMFQDSRQWGWKLLFSLLGILAGLVVFRHPLWSTVLVAEVAVLVLAFQALISGFLELIGGWRGKNWGMAILGLLSILLGMVLFLNPMLGAAALPFVLGVAAIVGGIGAIILAIRTR
jgi:uncharacterized membrane protein HdeD (DUF308 family)